MGPVKSVNHTSWVDVVTQTDRPKSARNRCVIELLVAFVVLSICPFDISVGVCHRNESDLFFFSIETRETMQENICFHF